MGQQKPVASMSDSEVLSIAADRLHENADTVAKLEPQFAGARDLAIVYRSVAARLELMTEPPEDQD